MIAAYFGVPGQGMTFDSIKKAQKEKLTLDARGLSKAELNTELLLFSSEYKMIESRFRATDRNLTIRLGNHAK